MLRFPIFSIGKRISRGSHVFDMWRSFPVFGRVGNVSLTVQKMKRYVLEIGASLGVVNDFKVILTSS